MKKLEEIRARVEKATLGPWDAVEGSEYDGADTIFGTLTADDHGGEVFKPTDAEFIAHSRTDVPELIAALAAVEEAAVKFEAAGQHSTTRNEFDRGYNAAMYVAAKYIRSTIQEALQ